MRFLPPRRWIVRVLLFGTLAVVLGVDYWVKFSNPKLRASGDFFGDIVFLVVLLLVVAFAWGIFLGDRSGFKKHND